MSTGEGRMWQTLRPLLAGLDPQRIESPSTGQGIPDVNLAQCWVELKYLPDWPKRATTLVRHQHWTTDQINWHRARRLAGGRSYLLLKVGKNDWLLFDGLMAAEHFGHLCRADLHRITIARWTRTPTRDELRTWLA